MTPSAWASRISDLRSKEGPGLTLAEIGEYIGLEPQSVCDIEQGRSKGPRGDAAVLLYELHKSRCSDFTSRKKAG